MADVVERLADAIIARDAKAIRRAFAQMLDEEGFAIVPKMPTDAMCWAGWRAEGAIFSADAQPMLAPSRCYRAMVAEGAMKPTD